MNRLPQATQAQIVSALVEGNSIRATCRMTGAAKGTVLKLLAEVGTACYEYQRRYLRGLTCKRLQCDEIWSFCYAKRRNVPLAVQDVFGYGDVWTFTALDADTKLVPCWLVGERSLNCAKEFIADLSSRVINRVQLTTDGLKIYLEAIESGFYREIDYAMLVKLFDEATSEEQRRYSPAICVGAEKRPILGTPNPKNISTSFVERQNLTMRMSMRRFTRLTNGFSRKVENLQHALSLHFMYYNFCRKHHTLKTTPAKAAGVASHIWSVYDIVTLTYGASAAA